MTRTFEHDRGEPHRRGRVVVLLLLVASLVAVDLGGADGQTKQRLEEAKQSYSRIQDQLDAATASYLAQQDRLETTRGRIAATEAQIRQISDRSDELRDQLRERVRTAYQMGGVGFLDFLLSAESLRDFSLRLVLLERQSSQDEDVLLQLDRSQGELEAKQRVLEEQKAVQAREAAAMRDRTQDLKSALDQAESFRDQLAQQYEAEQLAAIIRSRTQARARAAAGSVSGRTVGLQACPAQGPHSFSNDWGAPRGGGRRRHRGNDIFAPNGSPAAAVVSGRISRLRSGGLGGLAVYLWGDDGNEYYYAHMSGFAVSQGQQVSAGQTIAYVGNTGNARGTAPHIHFEVHPGGGGAINPYPSLIRVC